MTTSPIIIIGGGLAGSEAAWQLARRNVRVVLYEMKPHHFSPAHKSPHLAELVCSNSLRSNSIDNAAGLLKTELRFLDSLIMEAADATALPAGKALAVDRNRFSLYVEEKLASCKTVSIIREEVTDIPEDKILIVASGPLTSDALAQSISDITGDDYLYFYDAISPIIETDSIDFSKVFKASRYKSEQEGDYLNCPFTKEEYENFYKALTEGKEFPLRDFEEAKFFSGCQPIEVIAKSGINSLLFGPMKPVGLINPKTGKKPYAVLQLRQEDKEAMLYNMVGFQTKLTWPEQRRIFQMIPGLENAEFVRYGSIHRNTFINAPILLAKSLNLKSKDNIFFAGQITGVEGYIESAAVGLLAGLNVFSRLMDKEIAPPPETSALGSLIRYISETDSKNFQPMNINFGIFPPLSGKFARKERGVKYAERSIKDLEDWKRKTGFL